MKLVLALPLPTDPMIDVRCAAWMAALNKHPLVDCKWFPGHSCDENRNAIIYRTLREDPEMTHMFFLDADTVPPASAVQNLMDLAMPVACGVVPMLMAGRDLAWNVRIPDGDAWWPRKRPLPSEPFVTRHTGAACLLVERRVLEMVGWPWFKREQQDPSTGQVTKWSGDVWFSERINACGMQIWADPRVRCAHWKKLDLLALMEGRIVEHVEEPFAGADGLKDDAIDTTDITAEIERAARNVRVDFPGFGIQVK